MKKDKLHNIKNNGFKVPANYFDSLESDILNKLKLEKLTDGSPGFKTPDNYFDSLETSIFNKISSSEKETKVITLFSKKTVLYASSIAAAVMLIFSLSMIFENKPTFDSLDNKTVETYILNENIDSYEIASFLNEDDISEENFIDYNIEAETIENYIFDDLDVVDLF